MKYAPTIGLEIHAELNTASKMFCNCKNDPDEKIPNTNVCPICLGHPGTLPVINKKAVENIFKVGLALGGELAQNSKWDRKNYFYPDLPKSYQISQYDLPLVKGGKLYDVRITRIHLEEDAGRLQHSADPSTGSGQAASLVDFNRAGLPLMELVTEPDIKTADQAVAFAKELQLILRYLGVSNADMEKGNMRVEANISISKGSELGTKVEVKNINSFKAVRDAIAFEVERQSKILDDDGKIKQETRGWNDVKKITESQRSKEEAHDYRYLPEPDLPPLTIDGFNIDELKREIPELPGEKRVRFQKEYGLSESQTEILIGEPAFADFFEQAVSEVKTFIKDSAITQLIFNYLISDLRGALVTNVMELNEIKFTPEDFAHLVVLIHSKKITSRMAKDILAIMMENGGDPETIMAENKLEQVSDENALLEIVKKVIAGNPSAVADYKSGKSNALQFLVGQAMRELRGQGDPNSLRAIFEKELF